MIFSLKYHQVLDTSEGIYLRSLLASQSTILPSSLLLIGWGPGTQTLTNRFKGDIGILLPQLVDSDRPQDPKNCFLFARIRTVFNQMDGFEPSLHYPNGSQ